MSVVVRAALPGDAEGIVGLLRTTYGETYPLTEFYRPDRIRELQAGGLLISLVAAEGDRLLGHYALKPSGATAEIALGLVLPEARGRGLAGQMRVRAEELAEELGFAGLRGSPVTAHSYTQRLYERRGFHPTGLLLGAGDVSLAGFHERRTSHLVLYFKYLRPPQPLQLYAPAALQPLLASLYSSLGAPVQWRAVAGEAQGYSPGEYGPGRALWHFPGRAELALGDEVNTFLDFPLQQDGWGAAVERALELGFRFAALQPHLPAGERLWLQRYRGPVRPQDLDLCQPEARALASSILPQ